MNKTFIVIVVILVVLGLYFYLGPKSKKNKNQSIVSVTDQPSSVSVANKKVVMVVASENFRDEEYFEPKAILEKQGVIVKTASNKAGVARGVGGREATVDLLVTDVNPVDFDVVIFIGGPGSLEHLDNDNSYQLAQSTLGQGKILAAICVSPVILAKAGVLKDKEATVWSSFEDRSSIQILEDNGAKYVDKTVVVDGKIITANGPTAAQEFGRKISELLGL